ncbi:hypothetical protein PHLGIDRAFT_326289 [Phlebiopsis gigantea 11061_1 CR5-6]|uniref:CENP-V/GFA domain-containing protein n=1 Tax=Phlebiopsis gigantea (strain 11061_1 CR5-6) TaxID=745531 RepID=A0A0C3S2H1_PHLG1|nr:hypothetical protein PHLGIDRAFT_326289 [Phlebiopsis gigantea 11061_1 CR5-6]
MIYPGGCYCSSVRYEVNVQSATETRTSICHCRSCKKFFGTGFGLTTKVPKNSFRITQGSLKEHISDNGATVLCREFCERCGTGILEYGKESASKFRYIMTGTFDNPGEFPPEGEFFCKEREQWMPEIHNIFHKREIHD